MTPLLVSLSITAVLTAAFAFRFGYLDRPLVLVAFAGLLFTVEAMAQHFFLPPGAVGIEVAYICFPLAAVFVVATVITRRWEASEERRDPTPPARG